MSIESQTREIVDLIMNYIDRGISGPEQISEKLNSTEFDPEKVRDVLFMYIGIYGFRRMLKGIHLIEYLTINSKTKMKDIVNHEWPIEQFTNHIEELSDILLNTLKLLYDTYSDCRAEMPILFEFLENLPLFGFELPDQYTSNLTQQEHSDSDDREDGLNLFDQSYPINLGGLDHVDAQTIESVIKKARKTESDFETLNGDNAFDKQPLDYKIHNLRAILSRVTDIQREFQRIRLTGDCENYSDVLNPLEVNFQRYREKLQEKIRELSGHSQPDGEYKIIVSPTTVERMNPNEIMVYKVNPCPDEYECQYFRDALESPEEEGFCSECQFWHNQSDRRRPILDNNHEFAYKSILCRARESCPLEIACDHSHNFFESFYHPLKFRRHLCPYDNCANRYCPYYHTEQERDDWQNFLNVTFEAAMKKENGIQSNNGQKITELQDMSHKHNGNGHHEEKSEPENKYTNVLKCKLTIRSTYEDPSKLSLLFHKSRMYTGHPFFVHYQPYSKVNEHKKENTDLQGNQETKNI